MSDSAIPLPISARDGHHWELRATRKVSPRATLLWLPALGVAARNYDRFAEALADRGVEVFVHEWRGNGSSNRRASHDCDWRYQHLLEADLPSSWQATLDVRSSDALILGGHSLGGQLACCYAASLAERVPERLWLVASGTPWWGSFPRPQRYALPLIYRFLPWLAQCNGYLPGKRLGFGGNEAKGLIADWARIGLSNRYAAEGMNVDFETRLASITSRIEARVFEDDWLAPTGSMNALLAKMPEANRSLKCVNAASLGARADHFAWMRTPSSLAESLSASLG